MSHHVPFSALRGDLGAVLVKMEEMTKSGNGVALAKWKTKRLEEVAMRKQVRFYVAAYPGGAHMLK